MGVNVHNHVDQKVLSGIFRGRRIAYEIRCNLPLDRHGEKLQDRHPDCRILKRRSHADHPLVNRNDDFRESEGKDRSCFYT